MHTGTFPLPPTLYLLVNQYIPQLFHFLLCYNFMIIHTYQTISTFPYTITSWWSIHTATFSTFSCYNLRMTNTCSNISTSSYVITSCRSMHTGTFPLPPVLYFHVNHHTPQLFHFLLCYNFVMINTCSNLFTFSYVISWCRRIHTATLPLSPML